MPRFPRGFLASHIPAIASTMLSAVLISSPAAFMPAAGLHASAPAHSRLAASPNMMSELDLGASVIRGAAVLPTMYALMSLNEYMTHRYFQHLEFNRPDSLLWLKATIAKVTGDPVAPKVPGDGHVEVCRRARTPAEQTEDRSAAHTCKLRFVQHHAETYDDMSLKSDARWRGTKASMSLDDDAWRGTAFHWSATAIMTAQMLPSVLPTYMAMGFSPGETMAILLPSMLVHAVVWNAIHPPMHGEG